MKVNGMFYRGCIIYYCVACNDFFKIELIDENNDKICEHFVSWDVQPLDEDEIDCFGDVAKVIIELNYEVEIKNDK